MVVLQDLYPRRVFPESAADGDRYPILGDPWRRGGTSPAGAKFAGPVGVPGAPVLPDTGDGEKSNGNYFVGWADEKTDAVEPQRIVWTPPEVGQERFGPPQASGYIVDQATDPGAPTPTQPPDWQAVQAQPPGAGGSGPPPPWAATDGPAYSSQVGRLPPGYSSTTDGSLPGGAPIYTGGVGQPPAVPGTPQSPVAGVTYGRGVRQMASPYAVAMVRTRVIPMCAHVWGSDWDDTDELAMQLSTACETALQGTLAHMSMGIVESGGWVRDEKGSRGMHYALVVNIACPIIWPAQLERPLAAFGVTTTLR